LVGCPDESWNPPRRQAGDAWPITPQVSATELLERLAIFVDERVRVGKPVTRQPLRREILVGRDREDAITKAVAMAQPWYQQMAAMGTKEVDPAQVAGKMRVVVTRSFVLGSAEECANQLEEIGRSARVNPVVTRANWPELSTTEMVDYVRTLGRELIPAMRDFESSETLVR
jgi:hypothetical protein